MADELTGDTPAESDASVQYADPVTPGAEPQAGAAWWRYVVTVTGDVPQKEIANATGIDQSSISRWQRGTSSPRAEAVVALARAYGRSPVEALVAAGYLSSSEVGVVELTTLTGDLTGVSVDSLLNELRRRVLAASSQQAEGWPVGWSADNPTVSGPEDVQESGDLIG
jgi:transcriptional regulator with XRE-family HTH domain